MLKNDNLCFIDFETTGPDTLNDYPLQFGAVLVSIPSFKILEEFDSYINYPTNKELSVSAKKIHNIQYDDLDESPTPSKMLSTFFSKFGYEYSFAGWNVCFDIIFFRRLCEDFGFRKEYMQIKHRHLDVQSVAKALSQVGAITNPNLNLSGLCKFYELERSSLHSAYQDALLSSEVYKKLLTLMRNNN